MRNLCDNIIHETETRLRLSPTMVLHVEMGLYKHIKQRIQRTGKTCETSATTDKLERSQGLSQIRATTVHSTIIAEGCTKLPNSKQTYSFFCKRVNLAWYERKDVVESFVSHLFPQLATRSIYTGPHRPGSSSLVTNALARTPLSGWFSGRGRCRSSARARTCVIWSRGGIEAFPNRPS